MSRFCPRCGAAVQPQFSFCPKCGAALPALPEETAPQSTSARTRSVPVPSTPQSVQAQSAQAQSAPVRQTAPSVQRTHEPLPVHAIAIACKDSGAPIASAVIPEGFSCVAKVYEEDYNDFSTLRDGVLVYNDALGVTFRTDSKVLWEEYLTSLIKQGAALGGLNPNNESAFREPEELMLSYGRPSKETALTPCAKAVLPGWFAQNGQTLLQSMIQAQLDSDRLVSNVKTEIVSSACEPLLMKFTGTDKGQDIVVLVGCEYLGFEYRNAINPLAVMGGALGLLGGLMGMKQNVQAKSTDGPIPFGHGREYGKQSEIIRWGYHRIYSCVTPPEHEAEATEAFLKFVVSFRPDEALERRRAQREAEIQARLIQQTNALAVQALQGQMMAQQRAMETSRMIARNSAEMSAGIMDSWNKKMASDSRISAARSEAIRGVNTYQTTYGSPVEVSVAADHVYQNNHGDVYGVSGSAVDQDVLNQLNWTEIQRK